ncbi:tRNA (adenosine(37)-N6)-threonylcarbamoyltransferase complex ATPase subunit type 1 TsaE [Arcobacter sp.]|uniref:tRNA (adenosine(37)-N6)-threonylcarbamoyltransferase complex ATPase subunit type 1 TsaE n=1 Tax=unclassified Arcobacter TaxID=2593671 RepID=UPI003B002E7F
MEKIELILEENDLIKIINKLDKIIDKKESIVLLRGDLASGKTTLVKNYVKFLKIDDLVTSPTFSIQTIYGENIYHYDVYNKSLEEFISLGLLEEFEKEGIHFVEWGDDRLNELLNSYGFHTIKIDIEKLENKRRYIINA